MHNIGKMSKFVVNPKHKIYFLKEIGEACVQLQVDVKLLLHQSRMDHFGTYPNMVNLHTAYLYTLYTFLHKLLTRLTSLQFLHLLLTFGQVHLISTSQKLEVIRWKPWWARKEHTNPMLMIKEEQLMCIGWEGSCKEVTLSSSTRYFNWGNLNFKRQFHQPYKSLRRHRGNKAGEHCLMIGLTYTTLIGG